MNPRASRAAARAAVLAFALLVAGGVAGCDGADEGTPALSPGEPRGEGGTLVWVVADRVGEADPLSARSRAEQLVARQVHEPLVSELTGPFDDTREVPGLARVRATGHSTIWTAKLRRGVRFQDGTSFNAQAVLANVERWRTTGAGQALLPGLVDAFAPRFDVVKFILAAPDRNFDQRLEDPRLGIVAPRALRPPSGAGARFREAPGSGTGPFELRERAPSLRLLARNTGWWGATSGANLGPALDQVEFRTEPNPAVRLAQLDAGDAQLADELGPDQAELAGADPLLTTLRGQGQTWLGLERSVRGVDSAREIPSLAETWLAYVTVSD